jgi:hypothetical protein
MAQLITKTQYIDFLECPKNTWLKMHKPELLELFELTEFEKSLLEQGNLVEGWAQMLFPNGVAIDSRNAKAAKLTQEHISKKTPVIFQPTSTHNAFLARHDILEFDQASGKWNLYEIKSTSGVEENNKEIDHIEDASFQTIILKDLGVPLNRIFVVCLNKEYVRKGEVSVKELFKVEDVTEEVLSREENTRARMQQAKDSLLQQDESALECMCIYKGRSAHCTTFKYSYPHIPGYSVHDIYMIGKSKKKLEKLIETGIHTLETIPEEFELSDHQTMQVRAHKLQKPIVDLEAIKKELSTLQYPLYFLDYETYPSAIPLFDGFRPYQQTPFQFSLHVVREPNAEPQHHEFLYVGGEDPSLSMIEKLREYIGSVGHVVVWHKSFERDRTKELAERHPEHKEFLEDINNRLYDLEDIFKKRYHVHPDFKGKTSIKKVSPVLAPSVSYNELDIKDGATAYQKWYEMVAGSLDQTQKDKIAADLKKYCGLDTYAMYAIWKHLMELVAG